MKINRKKDMKLGVGRGSGWVREGMGGVKGGGSEYSQSTFVWNFQYIN